MRADVIDWLLEEDNPSVRYLAMTNLQGIPEDDPRASDARAAVMGSGIIHEILGRQNTDGSFGDPDRYYTDKYSGSAWTLLILAELAADPGDPRIQRACEFILSRSQVREEGGFAYEASKKTRSGLPGSIIPCLTGNMTYALVKLGFLHDDRVRQAIRWIARYQRTDDGDGAPQGIMYEHFDMCWGRHTCHMGAAKAFKALAAIPTAERGAEVSMKIGELAEYFLLHRIYKRSHSPDKISKPGWLKFGFPLMYQTDALELLGIFASLGIRDARLEEAIGLVERKCAPDGKWVMESSNNGKMITDIERKGDPSKWITLNALRALNRYR